MKKVKYNQGIAPIAAIIIGLIFGAVICIIQLGEVRPLQVDEIAGMRFVL